MSSVGNNSVFKEVNLHSQSNNKEHYTSDLSTEQLIVRRGQSFKVTLKVAKNFQPGLHSLLLTAANGGSYASENLGTLSRFGIPDSRNGSPTAKAAWTVKLHGNSSPNTLILLITPPPDTPIGKFTLKGSLWNEETQLATLVVLFNPWFSGDAVYMSDESKRQEYVLNENGVIYRGSADYISGMMWDFGQFEPGMVDICLKILDKNLKYKQNPGEDLSFRSSPAYVGRVVSAMINSNDDLGVLMGRWSGSYADGVSPSRWSSSYVILSQWMKNNCAPVKYGQCWVFAAVMCSVMRLLGIPTRVITNFDSAHDNDANLSIDVYHADIGVDPIHSNDSIWNFHVWVESWMTRPDLSKEGNYNGWQVLDPTPQERSNDIFQCGPASVIAVYQRHLQHPYDVPFVLAEVNANCTDWLVKANGTKVPLFSDTSRVGKQISTKAVGSNTREVITHTYKPIEGSEVEKNIYSYVMGTNREPVESSSSFVGSGGGTAADLVMYFKELSKPQYGKDVQLELVLSKTSTVEKAMEMSILVNVQGFRYNGISELIVHTEKKQVTLQPRKAASVPIAIPFTAYCKHMHVCDSLKVMAMVADKQQPDQTYLAENNVLLKGLPIDVSVSGFVRQHQEVSGEVVFMNSTSMELTGLTLTLSGSGLMLNEEIYRLPALPPSNRVRVQFVFVPYRAGEKKLVANIQAAAFKNIRGYCNVSVSPS